MTCCSWVYIELTAMKSQRKDMWRLMVLAKSKVAYSSGALIPL